VGLLLILASCRAPEPHPQNVILISVDTLRRSAVSAFDADAQPLPALDRFAAESVAFPHAYTTASWTLPAHASLFSGRYPNRAGVVRIQQSLPPELPLLPELLRSRGYQTIAFTDGALLDSQFGHSRGFQLYDAELQDPSLELHGALPRGGAQNRNHGVGLFDRAIAFLKQRAPEDPPFLLFLHTFSVHDYFMLYSRLVEPPPAGQELPNYLDCLLGERTCSAAQWSHMRQRYDAGVRVFDEAFGRLLGALGDTGLDDSTLVVLFADHGEGFEPDRGRIHHGGRVHADLIRIPLLIRVPGVGAAEILQPASLVDILPTVLDLLEVAPPPEGLDGVSLAAAIRGGEAPGERPLYAMEFAYRWENGRREYRPSNDPLSLAVIQNDGWYIRSGNAEEFYAMDADPLQRDNLALSRSEVADFRQLADIAGAWSGPAGVESLLDEEMERHLRALGYIQ